MRSRITIPNLKHYRNFSDRGNSFVTTGTQGAKPYFNDPASADIVVASLLSDISYYGASLWAFVVMPNHLHCLIGVPQDRSISWLMNRIKSNAGKRLIANKTSFTSLAALGWKLGDRIWERSFRSFEVETREDEAIKFNYIHMNPVKAMLCGSPELYRWSSADKVFDGYGSSEYGIVVTPDLINVFADSSMLKIRYTAE